MTETVWPSRPEIFTIWPFIEGVYQLVINTSLPSLMDGEIESGGESSKLECELHLSRLLSCVNWLSVARPHFMRSSKFEFYVKSSYL